MTELETLIKSGFSASEIDEAATPRSRELRPVVRALSAELQPSTVCVGCPQSLWFRSPSAIQCYCKPMHLITWSTHEPNQLIDCDQLHQKTEENQE